MNRHFRNNKPTIGVLAGWQFYRTANNYSYLLPAFGGINRAALDMGCNLLMGCGMGTSASTDDPLRPAWPVPGQDVDYVPIGDWNTDGLIIFAPLHSQDRSDYVHGLITSGHPVLFIGSGESGPTLAADNRSGIHEAVHHLVSHGHQKIAFIAGSPDDLAGDTGERLNAYREALLANGITYNESLVAYSRHVYDGGMNAARQIMAAGTGFTAVLASNDESALGAMKALEIDGYRIPQDIAVIGFDNRLEGAAHKPSLSSIHVPLYNIGYQAVIYLLRFIEGKADLPRLIRIGTRLVARESCGCGSLTRLATRRMSIPAQDDQGANQIQSYLTRHISSVILKQTENLGNEDCRDLSKGFVDAFFTSLEQDDGDIFLGVLNHILIRTNAAEDDPNIWQDAVTIIFQESVRNRGTSVSEKTSELLDRARHTISTFIQQEYRQYISDQRRVSSRLSLLTASLQTALDETRVYEILAQHLTDMDIRSARIVMFSGDSDDLLSWSLMRDALLPKKEQVRFQSMAFPPENIIDGQQPYHLALIPLVDQVGQLGYMVFGIEYFSLYGAIVQQLGGALNTARLYRQANEGRQMAEEANRMKSRFLSTISHELRTPLNLIVGLSSMVIQASDEGGMRLPDPAQKDVERIQMYAQHLGGLIGDVIDLATSDAGQLRLNNDLINLGRVLSIVAESGSQLAADKELEWDANIPEPAPWVWGDQTRLRQVAFNLINNAVKFTKNGKVRLWIETGEETVTVLVSDTGLGISPDEQEMIFDEFRQSERSIALGYGGLGLGLGISKRLIEMHNGSIGVVSTGIEGEGSTFYFTLPTIQPPVEPESRHVLKPRKQQLVQVLTDQPDSGGHIIELLEKRGFKVQIASFDKQADGEICPNGTIPDAILVDVSIASSLGWETLKSIKGSQAGGNIPVMFYKSARDNGAVLELDYLTKPIEMTELSRALDHQWLMADLHRQNRSVLVVDDDPNTLDMHARIVQSHSSTSSVIKARNGREALDLLGREPIDLVLLDLQMPEMDGFSVLEHMRENENMRNIPVIVVTGKVLTEIDMARLNSGVAAVLEKGLFSLDETMAHISRALGRKRRISIEAQRLVRRAMAYIHEHFADSITRGDVARYINISEDHLTFCFRQELGTTPIEYLNRYRINRARNLLKNSGRSVTEIAMDVGFSDSGYFSRIFHRQTGMSPESFRHA